MTRRNPLHDTHARSCAILGELNSGQWLHFILIAALLLAVMALPRQAFGQAEQGTITGTVRDSTGAVIANAKVTALEVSTRTVSSTVSNSQRVLHHSLPCSGNLRGHG